MIRRRAFALLLPFALAACGGGDEGEGSGAIPQDTLVRSLPAEPLSDSDFEGLDRANLVLPLPWSTNRISRDPGAAPRAILTSVDVSGHDGFDRVAFTFDEALSVPGYEVSVMESGAELRCGNGPQAVTVGSERMLVVRLAPSRPVDDEGRRTVPIRTSSVDHDRLEEAGLVCDGADVAIWVGGLAEGQQVRVLEMRNPHRVVVDVR